MATFCLMFLICFFAIAPQIAHKQQKKVSANAETLIMVRLAEFECLAHGLEGRC